MNGKAFAVRFSQKCTAKAARQIFARQWTFVVCFSSHAQQWTFAVRRGRRTAKKSSLTMRPSVTAADGVVSSLSCAALWTHDKRNKKKKKP
jgi:hypothetical protein